ncbi:MAG: T9SS type A sorting domain-containing protein [Bacteroidota bacterium]
MKLLLLFYLLLFYLSSAQAQFAPSAHQVGTTALSKDSSIFINWAIGATIERGPQNLADASTQTAAFGTADLAIGIADNQVVSLGDKGAITVTFNPPITNGEGADFAVFENGFATQDAFFLELAFVEVSSDGANFVRFPATSLTDTTIQIGTFDVLNPTQLHNLAGKYVANFGTPFDLAELADHTLLDISSITHVKVIDVGGSLVDSLASFDKDGRKINDPFPTPFPSGGFDLDAIGVIHEQTAVSSSEVIVKEKINIYPNPMNQQQILTVELPFSPKDKYSIQLFTANGALLENSVTTSRINQFPLQLPEGIYWVQIVKYELRTVQQLVVIRN